MFALAIASPACAAPYLIAIKVSAGPLGRTLQEIARQGGGELLFDHDAVAGLQAPKIERRTTVMAAVKDALMGTDLLVRQAASGALIVEKAAAPALARQDAEVSELLVIGHRTQNADIRRTETDIQPYQVITIDQIANAHDDDVGQYVETHVTANGGVKVLGTVVPGAANSQIDLRGLGADQTLILIDGRRMPDFPANTFDFTQPDLTSLPMHDIERVEILTGSAGGIYGFGALGGVINVVLAHDRPGVELNVTSGVTSRGDAARLTLESRAEFSADHGATDVTLNASFTRSQPLTDGERDYAANDQQTLFALQPSLALSLLTPNRNTIYAFDPFENEPLVLKPQLGGAALGSLYATLPVGFEGNQQALAAALLSGAGKLNFGLSGNEASSDLETNPETGSLLMNVRHQFGGDVEAYFDGIMLWNHGRFLDHAANGEGAMFLTPSSASDPFQQPVDVAFPMPLASNDWETWFNSSRFTFGAVTPLPFGWRATAEATWGRAQYKELYADQSGDVIPLTGNPFGSWSQFEQVLLAAPMTGSSKLETDNNYQEQSLRLAGPVFQTPAAPATLTVLVERRSEFVPTYTTSATGDQAYSASSTAARSTTTTSVYAELRSRIFDDVAPSPLLRDLELQLAARDDSQSNDFSTQAVPPERLHVTFTGASYTAGAKVSPLPWLTLRGSFATGQTPPPPEDLIGTVDQDGLVLNDPKRGGSEAFGFTEETGGSLSLKTVRATTGSVGLILAPLGPHSLRFSIDYSRIDETHAVELLDDDTVVDNEASWPQRVQRGPLTATDAALGYTAGPITNVDATSINGGGLQVQTVDAHLDWSFPLRQGQLHLYGAATYNFGLVVKALFMADYDRSGFADAPLTWRANAGADWSLGTLTIGANVQYFGSYNVGISGPLGAFFNGTIYEEQGAETEPAQTYLDLHVSKRIHLARSDLRVDFGVNDVLDTAPPRLSALAGGAGGYSLYGDPRLRRFDLTVSSLF